MFPAKSWPQLLVGSARFFALKLATSHEFDPAGLRLATVTLPELS